MIQMKPDLAPSAPPQVALPLPTSPVGADAAAKPATMGDKHPVSELQELCVKLGVSFTYDFHESDAG